MIHVLRKWVYRFTNPIFTAYIPIFFLAVAGLSLQAEERPALRESFVELDSEIQAIKQEIVAINQELLLLEESSLYPQGEQLVVLLSIADGSEVDPARVTLQLDAQTLKQHDYSGSESAALREGGVHRLYSGKLSEGEHTLNLSVSGNLGRGKVFKQQRSLSITKLPGRKTLEVQLGPGAKKSEAGVTIRQWQQ